MTEREDRFIVYVDTSYLTYMPAAERADWNRLLEYAKQCSGDLNVKPRLEIHLSEIALREYRGKLIDSLHSEIQSTNKQIISLNRKWQGSEITKDLNYPFPKDDSLLPKKDQIESAADKYIADILTPSVLIIDIKSHHSSAFWEKYFNWEAPFDTWTEIERNEPNIRDARRKHIPDAWILLAAIDAKNDGQNLLCLCNDGPLSAALEKIKHLRFREAKNVLDILFPPTPEPSPEGLAIENPTASDFQLNEITKLDSVLAKTINTITKEIYLRLLGFVVPLDSPSHESLIQKVANKGFDRRLVEACAVMLSDKSNPYLIDTGSHYIAGNKEVCDEAASRVTDEIIQMLEEM